MRDLGLPSALSDLFGPLVIVFALVTQLGDVWFLTILVALTYWLGPRRGEAIDRRRATLVLGLFFLGLTLVTVAKPLVGWPRPPGAGVAPRADLVPQALSGIYEWLSTGDGFGFPSGHAVGATVVYGGLAWAVREGRQRTRVAAAAALVAVVSLSRLVLGLHYLVDVLAGVTIGLAALAVTIKLARPRYVFGLASAVALLGLAFVGLSTPGPITDVVPVTAATVGATVAWLTLGDRIPVTPSSAGGVTTVVLGAVTAGPAMILASELHRPVAAVALAGFVGGALLVGLPLVGERVAKK